MQTHRTATIVRRGTEETEKPPPLVDAASATATGKKFMLTLRESVFSELQKFADQRGVTIQGLIRAVIVPEWHLEHPGTLEGSASQNSNLGQDQLAGESVGSQGWAKTRKAVKENVPSKVVA